MKEFLNQSEQMTKEVEELETQFFEGEKTDYDKKQEDTTAYLKSSELEDLSNEIFKEINPKGYFIGDIKRNLVAEVEALKIQMQEELKKELSDIDKTAIDNYK